VHAVLHGHTHVPRDELDQLGVRWLNPGCITRPRGAGTSFAWLLLEPGCSPEWRLVKL
jgi:predicted phosphodiesterase